MIKSRFSVEFHFKWTFYRKLIYDKTRNGSARLRFSTKFISSGLFKNEYNFDS